MKKEGALLKANIILTAVCAALLLLLCGCGAAQEPSSGVETDGEPMDITVFSFSHTASNAEECYRFQVSREGDEVRLYAEELFYGGRVADTAIDAAVLEQLCELAGTYGVADWDGFDKTKRNVRDGSGFALELLLEDGRTVSASGSNAFPENYAEVRGEIRALYTELMEKHGVYPAEIQS